MSYGNGMMPNYGGMGGVNAYQQNPYANQMEQLNKWFNQNQNNGMNGGNQQPQSQPQQTPIVENKVEKPKQVGRPKSNSAPKVGDK